MEVALVCDWPWELAIDGGMEQVAVLFGQSSPPPPSMKVYETHWSPYLPGKQFTITRIIPTFNSAPDTSHDFQIKRADLKRIVDEYSAPPLGWKMLGIAHSHPYPYTSQPSDNDINGSPKNWIGAVISEHEQRVRWFVGKAPATTI